MTREIIRQIERDYWAEKADPIDMAEIFDLAQKGLEQEPNCSKIPTGSIDYISKQEVVGLMMHIWGENFSGDDAMQECIDAIRAMPSVTPQEPKTGHWFRQTNDYVDYYECSECGMAMGLYDVKNYCPNCGSRNEVEE